MSTHETRQARFPGLRVVLWTAGAVVTVVAGIGLWVLASNSAERSRAEAAQTRQQLAELRDLVSRAQVDLERQRADARALLEAERAARRAVEDSLKEQADRAGRTEDELRHALDELKSLAQADRISLERELASSKVQAQAIASDAETKLREQAESLRALEQENLKLSAAYADALHEVDGLTEAELNARLQAQRQADLRANAEEVARQATWQTAQVSQNAAQVVAIETARRQQAELAAAEEARRRQRVQIELHRRTETQLAAFDREIAPLKQRFDRDMVDFKKQSDAYAARMDRFQKDYDARMKAARKIYHAELDRGVPEKTAKDGRKKAEAAAQQTYDTGRGQLINVDKPRMESLKEQTRRTSQQIADLNARREKTERDSH